jgi:hypothetical protein
VSLELHLNDAAADEVFRGAMPPLPVRDPPGRIGWLKPWAVVVLLAVMFGLALILAMFRLPWPGLVGAGVVGAFGIALALAACRPWIEEPD